MQLKIHARNPVGNSFVELINGKKTNICKVLMKGKMDPYLHKILQNIRRYSNLFEVCPLHSVGWIFQLNADN